MNVAVIQNSAFIGIFPDGLKKHEKYYGFLLKISTFAHRFGVDSCENAEIQWVSVFYEMNLTVEKM